MTNVRVSTVLVGAAVLALAISLTLLHRFPDQPDTPAAVLFFAVLPVTAIAGFVCSVVFLFRDRRVLRWVELLVSGALIVLMALER